MSAYQQHRQRWRAYAQARRKQQDVYRAVQRRWAQFYAAYHQLLLADPMAQPLEGWRGAVTNSPRLPHHSFPASTRRR